MLSILRKNLNTNIIMSYILSVTNIQKVYVRFLFYHVINVINLYNVKTQ